jgi:hypothetical protein
LGNPPDLQGLDPALLEVARPVRTAGKAPARLVRQTILRLCDGRYLTLRELSALLNRQTESLRDAYIREMLRDDLLELRFPSAPSHRNQAYRTRRNRQFE